MKIAEQIRGLELELLTSATRKNAERVAALLSDDFREFGSSGRVYTKDEIIATLQQEPDTPISAVDVEVRLLSDHVALVTYKSIVALPEGESTALRSSIWANEDGRWTMLFHQGTKLP